ncbi:MAG: GNAT family N-acetyltransferase [Pseudomonadales bacterium]|nr:GNAT family N-acetyltransferase [Pseudomonadales bacterium]
MIEIRLATKNDTKKNITKVADMMYSAGPEIYDFIYKTDDTTPVEFIEYEFKSGIGFCGYKNVTLALKDDTIVGTGCFYDGHAYKKLLFGTLYNMFKFYGLFKIWKVLERSGHAGQVMEEPLKKELYLSNFGVSPEVRGTGLGSKMLENKIEFSRNSGYLIFSLDVADTNPRAEALYTRHGLAVVKTKTFKGKREGIAVPDSKKMELVLT